MPLEENNKISNSVKERDDIDLTKVFSKIYETFLIISKLVIRFIFTLADTIFANFKLIIVITIIGGLLGLGYFYSNKPYYESNMTLSSDYFKGELLDNSIRNINEVAIEGNTNVLSDLLNISKKKAGNIKSIKVNPLLSHNYRMLLELYSKEEKYKGKLDSLLIYNNQSTFQLAVEVYDTAALKGLDTVLVNFIKNNDYVKKRIAVDRENLVNLKQKLNKESGSLDTLKRSIAASLRSSGDAGRNGTNNVILGEKSVNPIEIYREDLAIYNQRQEVERQLALNAEIEVIEKFIPYAEPKSGSLIKNTLKGAIAGLILALLIILYQMLRSGLTRLRYNLDTV